MENKEKLYIISFGNSSQYRMMYDGSKEQLEKSPRMSALKNELIEFIKDKVPMGSHAERYATPEIHEVENRDAAKYADYIDFDSVAVEDIKKNAFKRCGKHARTKADGQQRPLRQHLHPHQVIIRINSLSGKKQTPTNAVKAGQASEHALLYSIAISASVIMLYLDRASNSLKRACKYPKPTAGWH